MESKGTFAFRDASSKKRKRDFQSDRFANLNKSSETETGRENNASSEQTESVPSNVKHVIKNTPHFRLQSIQNKKKPAPCPPKLSEKHLQLLRSRANLPIWPHTHTIRLSLFGERNLLVLVGETGSGKSTQVPQMLLSQPWCKGCVAVTEPRRVAATSLARRVAEEMGTPLGNSSPASKVGYSVRFDNNCAPGTKIKFLTEGMLLQELLRDPWLKAYSVVIVDEVHERGVNVDLILGFLRRILAAQEAGPEKLRKVRGKMGPLKVVVMSATADTEKLIKFFAEGFGEELHYLNSHANVDSETTKDFQRMKVDEAAIEKNATTNGEAYAPSESSWSGLSSSDESEDKSKENRQDNLMKLHTYNKEDVIKQNTKYALSARMSTVYIEGRQHHVDILHMPEPTNDFTEAALNAIFQIHCKEPLPGDILVFLTGQEVVESLEHLVNEHVAAAMGPDVPKIQALPLFAALPRTAQQAVFEPTPAGTRKVILATNIAETSVTIPGVHFVVDCGLAKVKEFRPNLGLDSLLVKPISKSSAMQRKGRAGREAPGKCYRLYTEKDYWALATSNVPEILRCDLALSLLIMKARGVDDVLNFPFLDPPEPQAIRKALLQLHRLSALSDTGEITKTGKKMARLPLPPALSRVLVASAEPQFDCTLDAIDIVAALTVENLFLPLITDEKREEAEAARSALFRREGDHLTLMAAVQAYAAEKSDRKEWANRRFVSHRAMRSVMDVRKQLRAQCTQMHLPDKDTAAAGIDDGISKSANEPERAEALLRCFMCGFAGNTARLVQDGSYRTMEGNQTVAIHPGSVLYGRKVEAIMYNELVFTSKCYARGVSAVQVGWYGDVVGGV